MDGGDFVGRDSCSEMETQISSGAQIGFESNDDASTEIRNEDDTR